MITAIKKILTNDIAVFGGIFLISALSLMTALIAQYVFGLQPCPLCLYQRVPYVLTALLGIGGLALLYRHEGTRFSAPLTALCGFIFLAESAIAFYHSGVERHWWKSFLEGCAADFDPGKSAADLMALFDNKPAVRCDAIPWADPFFGLSMANYNAALSLGLACACFLSAFLLLQKKKSV